MGKRKLRSCSNCGMWHGPPTGKLCSRAEEVFAEKNSEMLGDESERPEAATGTEAPSDLGAAGGICEEEGEWLFPDYPETHECMPAGKRIVKKFDFVNAAAKKVPDTTDARNRGAPVPEPAGASGPEVRHRQQAGAAMADCLPEPPTRRRVGLSSSEVMMSDRIGKMEKTISDVATYQQSQIDKIVDLFTAMHKEKKVGAKAASQCYTAAKPSPTVGTESSDSDSDEEEWKEFFGAKVWKEEKDRKRKNPFDHKNYGKKGEVVQTFEQLMVVLLKTMSQFMDLRYDVRGIIKHGLMLAEKAAKDVYRPEAFVQYDESVRTRAGQVGPTAFASIDQVLRFFSCDNLKVKRPTGGSGKAGQPRKDKICLRFNDGGCSNKNCQYSHKCLACEDTGHSKKDCKNVNSKKKESK